MKHLNINLSNNKFIKIQLKDNSLTEKWIDVHNKMVDEGVNYFCNEDFTIPCPLLKEPESVGGFSKQDCVDEINKAIDDANKLIFGKQVPYKAYLGMPWSHTNRLHRCFTTSIVNYNQWKHNLTFEQLNEYKVKAYENRDAIHSMMTGTEYYVPPENRDAFLIAVEKINNWVHNYECFHGSIRADEATKELGFTRLLELQWDNYEPVTGIRNPFHRDRASFEEIKASAHEWFEYDVYIGKSIAGKDYEYAYAQYDDPLEFDITNLDWIDGSIRFMYDIAAQDTYRGHSPIAKWAKEHGIDDWFWKPVPLGKIVDTNVDWTKLKADDSRKINYTFSPLGKPFDKITTEIVVS